MSEFKIAELFFVTGTDGREISIDIEDETGHVNIEGMGVSFNAEDLAKYIDFLDGIHQVMTYNEELDDLEEDYFDDCDDCDDCDGCDFEDDEEYDDIAPEYGDIPNGTYVKVIDNGQGFSTYQDWAKKYLPKYERFTYSDLVPEGIVCKVVCSAPHDEEDHYGIIYGVADEYGQAYIIGKSGIEVLVNF